MQLSLRIRKKELIRLITGEKKTEYRSGSEFYCKKLAANYNTKSKEKVEFEPKPFTTVLFFTGESKNDLRAVFEIKSIELWKYIDCVPKDEDFEIGDINFHINIGKFLESNYKEAVN